MLRTFRRGDDLFDVPESELELFRRDMPDAVEIKEYDVGGQIQEVPSNEMDSFLANTPEAKPVEKIGQSDSVPSPPSLVDSPLGTQPVAPGFHAPVVPDAQPQEPVQEEAKSQLPPPSTRMPSDDGFGVGETPNAATDYRQVEDGYFKQPKQGESDVANLFDDDRNKAIIDQIASTGSMQGAYDKFMRDRGVDPGNLEELPPNEPITDAAGSLLYKLQEATKGMGGLPTVMDPLNVLETRDEKGWRKDVSGALEAGTENIIVGLGKNFDGGARYLYENVRTLYGATDLVGEDGIALLPRHEKLPEFFRPFSILSKAMDPIAEQAQRVAPKFEKGIIEEASSGNWSDAGYQLGISAVEQLPQILITLIGAMIGNPNMILPIFGMMAAGNKIGELDRDPNAANMTERQKLTNMMLTGVIEVLVEKIQINHFLPIGDKGAKDLFKYGIRQAFRDAAKGSIGEGFEEAITEAAGVLIDILTGYMDPEDATLSLVEFVKKYAMRIGDAALVGAASGGPMGGIGVVDQKSRSVEANRMKEFFKKDGMSDKDAESATAFKFAESAREQLEKNGEDGAKIDKYLEENYGLKRTDLDEGWKPEKQGPIDETPQEQAATDQGNENIEVVNETEAIDEIAAEIAAERGIDIDEATIDQLDDIYDEAKRVHGERQLEDRSTRFDETKQVVDEVTENWKNRDGIKVVETEDQLPPQIKQAKKAQLSIAILQQNGESVKFSREELSEMGKKKVIALARENGVEFKTKAKYLPKGEIVENLWRKGTNDLQSGKIRDNMDHYEEAKDNRATLKLREGESWLPGFEPEQEFLPGLGPEADVLGKGRREVRYGDATKNTIYRPRPLAKIFSDELKATGATSLIGKPVSSSLDLATISQRLRDIRYETLRVIGIKDGKVSEIQSISQRLPGAVAFRIPNLDKVRKRMSDDYDGYYLLHNHPSGHSMPSSRDLTMTGYVTNTKGFLGHVIINHNEYSFISPTGFPDTIKHSFKSIEPNKAGDESLLGVKLGGPEYVADFGKKLSAKTNVPAVVFCTPKLHTRGVFEMDTRGFFENEKRFLAWLRKTARELGSDNIFVVNVPSVEMENAWNLRKMKELQRRGFIYDWVSEDGFSTYEQGLHSENRLGVTKVGEFRFGENREDYKFSITGESADPRKARQRDLERRRREQHPEWAWIKDHFKTGIGPQAGQVVEWEHALEGISTAAKKTGKAGLLNRKGSPADFVVSMINETPENGGMGLDWSVDDLLAYAVGLGKGLPTVVNEAKTLDIDLFEKKMRDDMIDSIQERVLLGGDPLTPNEIREFPELAEFVEKLRETDSLADAMLDITAVAKGDKARVYKTLREAAYQKAVQDADSKTILKEAQQYVIDYARRFMPKAQMSKVLKWLDGRLENNNNLLKALAEIDMARSKAKMTKSKKAKLLKETKANIKERAETLIRKRGLRMLERRNVDVENWEPRTFGDIVRKAFDEGRSQQKTLMNDVNTFVEDTITQAFRALATKYEGDLPRWRGALEQVTDEFEALKKDLANARNSKEKVTLAKQHLELMFGDRYLAIRRSTKHNVFRTMKHLNDTLQEHLGRYYSKAFTRLFNSVNPDKLYNGEGEMNFANQWRALAKDVKTAAELAKEIRSAKGYRAKLRNVKAGPKQIAEVTDRIEDAERRMRMLFENKRYLESRELLNRFSEIKAQSELMQEKIKEGIDIFRHDLSNEFEKEMRSSLPDISAQDEERHHRNLVKHLLTDLPGTLESWALTLCGGNEKSAIYQIVYERIRKAQNKALTAEAKADKAIHEMLVKHGFAKKDKHGGVWVDNKTFLNLVSKAKTRKLVNGQKMKFTDAQIMNLYALTLDEDALKKLLKNGFKPRQMKNKNRIMDVVGMSRPERVAVIDDLISNHLTAEQRALVEDMVRYVTEQGIEGNKTSLKLLGYEKFLSPSHWKEEVDRSGNPKYQSGEDLMQAKGYGAATLNDVGFTKDRVQHSHPLVLGNVFQLFEQQTSEMATWTHMAIETLDVINVMNAANVKSELTYKVGTKMPSMIFGVIQRATGLNKHSENWSGFDRLAAKLQRNFAVSILGFRLSSGWTNLLGGSILYTSELLKKDPKVAAMYLEKSLPYSFWFSKKNREVKRKLFEDGYLYKRWMVTPVQTFANLPIDVKDQKSKMEMRKRRLQGISMQLMALAEMRNAVMLYKSLEARGYSPEKALDVINKMTRDTQNPSTALEETGYYSMIKESPALGFLFPFYGQPAVMRNLLLKDVLKKDYRSIGVTASALALSALFVTASRYLTWAARSGMFHDDDEEKEQRGLFYSIKGFTQEMVETFILPMAGRVSSTVIDAISKWMSDDSGDSKAMKINKILKGILFDPNSDLRETTAWRWLKDTINGVANVLDATESGKQSDIESAVVNLSNSVGMIAGLPTGGIEQGAKVVSGGLFNHPLGWDNTVRMVSSKLIEGMMPSDANIQAIGEMNEKERYKLRGMAKEHLSKDQYQEYRDKVLMATKEAKAERAAKRKPKKKKDPALERFKILHAEAKAGILPNMDEFMKLSLDDKIMLWEFYDGKNEKERTVPVPELKRFKEQWEEAEKKKKDQSHNDARAVLEKINNNVFPTAEEVIPLTNEEKKVVENAFVNTWGQDSWDRLKRKIGRATTLSQYRRKRYHERDAMAPTR